MATEAVEPRSRSFKDASPREVRAALVPEERSDFDLQWRQVMTDAVDSLDLSDVLDLLESWRRRATITNHLGHDGYREMMARAERVIRTGEPTPGSVGEDEIGKLIMERLGR